MKEMIGRHTDKLTPEARLRYRQAVKRIERANTAKELVDLADTAIGFVGSAWHKRAEAFGPEIIPLISERLRMATGIQNHHTKTIITETLLGELRWRGKAGVEVLLERFENLGYYGRSLACVVFGLMGVRSAIDTIWNYYQKAINNRQNDYFVGALWGLVDLENDRVADLLLELLLKQRYFGELYGFLSKAGDGRAIAPILLETIHLPEEERFEPLLAVRGIGYRIGREAVIAALEEATDGDTEFAQKLADPLLTSEISVEDIEEHFELFYRAPNRGVEQDGEQA